jgi:hypothetical protein
MNIYLNALLALMTLMTVTVHAKSLDLRKNSSSIFIQEKPTWKLAKNLFGIPFLYFSPIKSGQRSNISFTDTGAKLELEIKALANSQKDYEKDRRAWAKKVGASLVSFLPYEVSSNLHGHKVHSIGFSYAHKNKVYYEKSYYIECRGKILFSKSLRLRENENHEKDFTDLIQSLDCGGF